MFAIILTDNGPEKVWLRASKAEAIDHAVVVANDNINDMTPEGLKKFRKSFEERGNDGYMECVHIVEVEEL